jgi:hypothetical protein
MMGIDRALGVLGLVLGLAPYGVVVVRWASTRRPARAFLRLHSNGPIHVIVSTNAVRNAGVGEAKTNLTAVGELRAVAVGARTVLRLYGHSKVSVFMSNEYHRRLEHDVLILGGPLRNSYAERMFRDVNLRYPDARLHLDARSAAIGLGGFVTTFDQGIRGGVPDEDLALLLIADAPWADGVNRRVVLCAGLSTYGTEGAARFLFQRVLGPSPDGHALRKRLSGPAAAALVRVSIEDSQVLRTELFEDRSWSATGAPRRAIAPVVALRGRRA